MPVVASALVPSSPLLLTGLARSVKMSTSKTRTALSALAAELYARQPDIIFIMAVNTSDERLPDFSLMQGGSFRLNYETMGDLLARMQRNAAVGFIHRLKEGLETSFPLPLVTLNNLPFNLGLPLLSLGEALGKVPLAALLLSPAASPDELDRLGQLIGAAFKATRERIVVVAAGNLSSAAHSQGLIFDREFQLAVQQGEMGRLLNLNPMVRQAAHESLWTAAILLDKITGATGQLPYIFSYESPFNTGWLVAGVPLN